MRLKAKHTDLSFRLVYFVRARTTRSKLWRTDWCKQAPVHSQLWDLI